ncbi:MAG: replicative DNA helicase [Planctomycetota bacterium]
MDESSREGRPNGRGSRGRNNGLGEGSRATPSELGKLFDRLPPNSPEAEMALLGSMLLDPAVVGDAITIVEKPEAFYSQAHGDIFRALRDVYDKHQSGDLVQISEALKQGGALDRAGGPDYLLELAEGVPSAVNAPHYARIVRDKARLRNLIDAAGTILWDAYHSEGKDHDEIQLVLESAEQAVFKVAREESTSDPQKLADLLHQELERLEALEGAGVSGLRTGFTDLDEKLSGLHEGEMIIVAARPSMGKTAFALNLAEQISLGGVAPGVQTSGKKEHIPVGVFSLEMSKQAVVGRLLSAYSGVDSHSMRTGRFTDADFTGKIIPACSALAEAPIIIDDTPGLTLLGLRARARRMVAQDKVRVLMIDYLQLLTSPGHGRESRQVEVSAISRGVKALARELKVPVVCLAQLNRGSEQREGHKPRMSDLRESGSIEQDADVVALLHRESYYHTGDDAWFEENRERANESELIIAKQRNGPTGTVKLTWDAATTRFKNHAGYGGYGGGGYDDYPFEPKPSASAPGASGGYQPGSAFGTRPRTGPAENHRDGGGSDFRQDNDISGLPGVE